MLVENQLALELIAEMTAYDPSMFAWLDETGCDKRTAVREYGYALRGMTPRCYSFKCGRGTQL